MTLKPRFFASAGSALHDEGGIAADGGGDVFAHPAFGGSGQAVEEEGAVGGKRGDGDFHQAAVADVFGFDGEAVFQGAADEVGDDGLRRELPVVRHGVGFLLFEFVQFFGGLLFGVLAEDVVHGGSLWGCS